MVRRTTKNIPLDNPLENTPDLPEGTVIDMLSNCGTSDRLEAYAARMGTMICHWCGGPHMLRECTNSWSSRTQSVVALSTTEAEYYALCEATKEASHSDESACFELRVL